MLGSKGSTKLLMEDQTGRGGWTMLGEPCMPELGLRRWAEGEGQAFQTQKQENRYCKSIQGVLHGVT